jgi:hypothetical protein
MGHPDFSAQVQWERSIDRECQRCTMTPSIRCRRAMIEAIVRFSVRRPGIVLALALVLAAYAVSRMFDARLDVFPEFAPAQVVIQTEAPGLPGGSGRDARHHTDRGGGVGHARHQASCGRNRSPACRW